MYFLKRVLAIFINIVFFCKIKTKTSSSKISVTTHAILNFFEVPETLAKMLATFFFLSDFGLRKVANEMDELFVFSVRAQENFETSSSKILRTTHGIFIFLKILKVQRK